MNLVVECSFQHELCRHAHCIREQLPVEQWPKWMQDLEQAPKDCYVDWTSWNGQGFRIVHKPDCIEVRAHEHDERCPHHQP